MSTKIYANARFGFREDTLENWMANNPVLERGEPAVVRDGENGEWLKIGDGRTDFNNLPWKKGPKGADGTGAIVDQIYDPESENAQSGKAVSQAFLDVVDVNFDESSWLGGPPDLENGIYDILHIEISSGHVSISLDQGYISLDNSNFPASANTNSKLYIELGEWGSHPSGNPEAYPIIKLQVIMSKFLTFNDVELTFNGPNNNPISSTAVFEMVNPIYGDIYEAQRQAAEAGQNADASMQAASNASSEAQSAYSLANEARSVAEQSVIHYSNFRNGDTVYLYNNSIYTANTPITEAHFTESYGMSMVSFTTADSGDISITFDESFKFIGGAPKFKNSETWEISINDGVVVGGLVE